MLMLMLMLMLSGWCYILLSSPGVVLIFMFMFCCRSVVLPGVSVFSCFRVLSWCGVDVDQ